MLVVNFYRAILVFTTLLISGCSFFSSGKASYEQVVEVKINTGLNVNPDRNNRPQPVKVCIIETRRAGWLPPGVYKGEICSGLSGLTDIVTFENYIMAPGQSRTYRTTAQLPELYTRWIVIGAEFQKGVGEYSLIEKMIVPDGNFKMEIMAENTSLTVL